MHHPGVSRLVVPLAIVAAIAAAPAAQDITLPNASDSLKIAVIGDSGTGDSAQYKVAEKLVASRAKFPYELVLMMGDNLYSGSAPRDFEKKFEAPYKPLLDSGMKFYASLGNHDNPNERYYKTFNMNGERYYTFKPKGNVRFLRARQQLHGQAAAAVAGEGAGGERIGLEDRLFPSSAVFIRRHARLRHAAPRAARASVPQVRRGCGLQRPRTLLRADQAAEGHLLLHLGRRRYGPQGRRRQDEPDGQGLRHRLPLHAGRVLEGHDAFPDNQRQGRDGRCRRPAALQRRG